MAEQGPPALRSSRPSPPCRPGPLCPKSRSYSHRSSLQRPRATPLPTMIPSSSPPAARATPRPSAAPCWRRSSAVRPSGRLPAGPRPAPRRSISAPTATGNTASPFLPRRRLPPQHRHSSPLPRMPAPCRCPPCSLRPPRRRQPRSRRPQHRSLSRLPRSPLPPLRQSTNGPLRPTATKEAEAALNERIRADHILLSNPVVVRGLGNSPRSSVPHWTASGR